MLTIKKTQSANDFIFFALAHEGSPLPRHLIIQPTVQSA